MKTWIPRLLQDDAMIPMCESPSYAKACTQYVEYKDYEQALAEKDREIQQIREHEFQRGYQEAQEKYQQILEKAVKFAEAFEVIAHDAEQRATIKQQAQEIARLREALEIYREASFQSHNGHWDMTMQHGAGCPECIRVRELRAKADHIVAQQALKDSQTSK